MSKRILTVQENINGSQIVNLGMEIQSSLNRPEGYFLSDEFVDYCVELSVIKQKVLDKIYPSFIEEETGLKY